MERILTAVGVLAAMVGIASCAAAGSVTVARQQTLAPTPSPSCATTFQVSLVSDRNGQPTPLAAARWFGHHGRVPAVPESGWYQLSGSAGEAELASGSSRLHAVQGPDKTWQVDSGSPCG